MRSLILGAKSDILSPCDRPLSPLSVPRTTQSNPEVIDALYLIRRTSYENSFLSRVQGIQHQNFGCLAVDWENRTPWMDLMQDIREHFALLQSVELFLSLSHGLMCLYSSADRDRAIEVEAPIEYVSLQALHLPQVHEILRRAFWDGIDGV